MRTREKSYKDYGLHKHEKEIVDKYCTNPGPEEQKHIFDTVTEVEPTIAQQLYDSLVKKQSYDLQEKKSYIPIGKKDFYGYRRKAIHLLYQRITTEK